MEILGERDMTYEVTWSLVNEDAANPVDAAQQAWASLDSAVREGVGATILVVRWTHGGEDHVMRLDMADVEEPVLV